MFMDLRQRLADISENNPNPRTCLDHATNCLHGCDPRPDVQSRTKSCGMAVNMPLQCAIPSKAHKNVIDHLGQGECTLSRRFPVLRQNECRRRGDA